jgi:ubiquitin-protein ligase
MEIEPIRVNINDIDYYIYEFNNQLYCKSLQKQDIIDRINIKLSTLKNKKNIEFIDIINKCILIEYTQPDFDMFELIDQYYMFTNNIIKKYKINKKELLDNYKLQIDKINNKSSLSCIPKELVLNNKQLFELLINEIDKINSNLSYAHYIVVNNSDILNISFRFVYSDDNEKYFELNLQLSEYYPFMPPKVSYVKPKINLNLVASILNLDLWNIKNWNYSITLEWLITNLGNVLEPLFNKYLESDEFNFLELKFIELNSITKYFTYATIPIEFNSLEFISLDYIKKNSSELNTKKNMSSGVGYGTNDHTKWDISSYIDLTKTKNQSIINILSEMNNYISNNEYVLFDIFIEYLLNEIKNISILEFNNNIDKFKIIISIFDNIETKLDIKYIQIFNDNIYNLVVSINYMIVLRDSNKETEILLQDHIYVVEIANRYKKYFIASSKEEILDEKNKYIQMVKEQSCDSIELTNYHLYFKNNTLPISKKSISRIMFELTTLNKDLPINWDSSVIMRMIDSNLNFFSFIITGPKDTPYHNGLFEFHAYIPDGYPNVVPQVLLKTTGNNSVRFNPNLYANGKVCLSLLGTWSGDKGESWIPEISTFYQVLISIQSLILVEQPYFNEPGYERELNTPQGKIKSDNYNDNIRYETVRVAMINMIENPPKGYEEFVGEYFKYKKNEILETVGQWCNESNEKERFEKIYNNLKIILNKI